MMGRKIAKIAALAIIGIKIIIRTIIPEEPKNWIPCVVFGSLIIMLGMANVWKWVLR